VTHSRGKRQIAQLSVLRVWVSHKL